MGRPDELPERVREGLRRARLLALDVDGTLTDGRIVHLDGMELQSFCVHDGQGLAWLREAGVEVTWITGRGCKATRTRAKELGVRELHVKAGPKRQVLAEVQRRTGIDADRTVAMGDDLPDLAMAPLAAVFACPPGARPEVRERAEVVTRAEAGSGSVRELAELILRFQGSWDDIVGRYGA